MQQLQQQQQQPVIIPNTIQPNPPVPRHVILCRSNDRVHHPQQIQQQQAPPLSQQQMQNLSPIPSCSETESGLPLGMGLSIRTVAAGPIQLQKSPSAPPLKRQHHSSQQHSGLPNRPAFEFPPHPHHLRLMARRLRAAAESWAATYATDRMKVFPESDPP
jgi:hypothetical protein